MANFFVDKLGRKISAGERASLLKTEGYSVLAEFENEDYKAHSVWNGEVDVRASQDYWTPFLFESWTKVDGKWVYDCFSHQKCKTAEMAIEAYQLFLGNYAGCSIVLDNGKVSSFREKDNKLTPPPPPNPDTPSSMNLLAGSW